LASLFGSNNQAEKIFYDNGWTQRRQTDQENEDWYSGETLATELSDVPGPDSQLQLRYPLQINPIGKICRIHRGVFIGILPRQYASMPVNILFGTSDEQTKDPDYIKIQETLNGIWEDSNAGSLFIESGIKLQVHGGYAFKVAYEPDNDRLRFGLRIIGLEQAKIDPTFNPTDPWDILSCRIGYLISRDDARAIYGVDVPAGKQDVVYLEDWNKQTYTITVDDKPVASGAHNLGRVPIVYIPRERSKNWGTSRVPELVGMSKEKNERALDRGDLIYSMTHTRLAGKNLKGDVEVRPIFDATGRMIDQYLYLGQGTPGMAGTDPAMDYLSQTGLPESVASFDAELWEEIRRQSDTASVAMGDDDVSGGRITGPVTAYRMWPTMSATQNDRVEFSTGLREISNIILRYLKQNKVTDVPAIANEHLKVRIGTDWPEQIPIEVTEKNAMLVSRLQAGGISVVDFLKELGVRDYEAAAERIWKDKERQAKIDAEAKVAVVEAQNEAKAEQQQQQMDMAQEKHDQQMSFAEDSHAAQVQAAKQKAAQPKSAPFGGK
jgi:hypothetical protein